MKRETLLELEVYNTSLNVLLNIATLKCCKCIFCCEKKDVKLCEVPDVTCHDKLP